MERYISKSITFTLALTLLLNSAQALCMYNNNTSEEIAIEINESAEKSGYFRYIPDDAIREILQFLDGKTLKIFRKLNKHLKSIVDGIALQIDIDSLIRDQRLITNNEKAVCTEKIKQFIKTTKKKLKNHEPLLFIHKKASKALGVKELNTQNFRYYIYKILKKEMQYYKDSCQVDDTQITKIKKTSCVMLFFTIITLLSILWFTPTVIEYTPYNIANGTINFDQKKYDELPQHTFSILSWALIFIVYSSLCGCSFSQHLSQHLSSFISKIMEKINQARQDHLYKEKDLEKTIFDISFTEEIKNTLEKLETLDDAAKQNHDYKKVETLSTGEQNNTHELQKLTKEIKILERQMKEKERLLVQTRKKQLLQKLKQQIDIEKFRQWSPNSKIYPISTLSKKDDIELDLEFQEV